MSELKFGTSGLRGLVSDLSGAPARQWTCAFLRHAGGPGDTLMVGRDLRSSSPAIAADCIGAALAEGWRVVDCGALPTPALALWAQGHGAAAVMVTGSHIPDDRNGLKFYLPSGEIAKADEAAIRAVFDAGVEDPGRRKGAHDDGAAPALAAYARRYIDWFGPTALSGLQVGVYQQSTVARDILCDILGALGARTVPLGRSDRFIPVDTEANRPEDLALLRQWAGESHFDAIVSADGDADRPLVADRTGEVLRGDLLGLITAQHLATRTIVTPVTSSTAVERSGIAERVYRTRVGSPFVIERMAQAAQEGAEGIIGFEANGGVLLGSDLLDGERRLAALPTRDALLPIVAALARARREPLDKAAATLGAGHYLADRLKDIPAERSAALLTRLGQDRQFAERFLEPAGGMVALDRTDGVRTELADGATIHFRASGNAPEFRVYVEAGDAQRARDLLAWGLTAAARELAGPAQGISR